MKNSHFRSPCASTSKNLLLIWIAIAEVALCSPRTGIQGIPTDMFIKAGSSADNGFHLVELKPHQLLLDMNRRLKSGKLRGDLLETEIIDANRGILRLGGRTGALLQVTQGLYFDREGISKQEEMDITGMLSTLTGASIGSDTYRVFTSQQDLDQGIVLPPQPGGTSTVFPFVSSKSEYGRNFLVREDDGNVLGVVQAGTGEYQKAKTLRTEPQSPLNRMTVDVPEKHPLHGFSYEHPLDRRFVAFSDGEVVIFQTTQDLVNLASNNREMNIQIQHVATFKLAPDELSNLRNSKHPSKLDIKVENILYLNNNKVLASRGQYLDDQSAETSDLEIFDLTRTPKKLLGVCEKKTGEYRATAKDATTLTQARMMVDYVWAPHINKQKIKNAGLNDTTFENEFVERFDGVVHFGSNRWLYYRGSQLLAALDYKTLAGDHEITWTHETYFENVVEYATTKTCILVQHKRGETFLTMTDRTTKELRGIYHTSALREPHAQLQSTGGLMAPKQLTAGQSNKLKQELVTQYGTVFAFKSMEKIALSCEVRFPDGFALLLDSDQIVGIQNRSIDVSNPIIRLQCLITDQAIISRDAETRDRVSFVRTDVTTGQLTRQQFYATESDMKGELVAKIGEPIPRFTITGVRADWFQGLASKVERRWDTLTDRAYAFASKTGSIMVYDEESVLIYVLDTLEMNEIYYCNGAKNPIQK